MVEVEEGLERDNDVDMNADNEIGTEGPPPRLMITKMVGSTVVPNLLTILEKMIECVLVLTSSYLT